MPRSRRNRSAAATFEDTIFASGNFKDVRMGRYIRGPRKGQACVAKTFSDRSVYEDLYFAEELNVIAKTQSILNAWEDANLIDQPITLNAPEIWEYSNGQKVLVEPFIQNFRKFNSNTGWVPPAADTWTDCIQALSHFSYHNSDFCCAMCRVVSIQTERGYACMIAKTGTEYRRTAC